MVDRVEEPQAGRRRHSLVGTITSAGFASGDRFVVGSWLESPIGAFTDVMWAAPDGERVLLVGTEAAGRFVSAVYRFDRVDVVPFRTELSATVLDVEAGHLRLHAQAGRGWRIPFAHLRPPWVTRWVEGPLAFSLLGVRTYGVSPTGVREWYRADEYRPVAAAKASVAGRSLGDLLPRWAPAAFGFSEPPRSSAMVRVRPVLEDPADRLSRTLTYA